MKKYADQKELCSDDIMASIEILLHSPDKPRSELLAACKKLVQIGEQTWWRCRCGAIRPNRNKIDIFCNNCNEFRYLPQRLARSPWPLYIQCLMQLMPESWFHTLGNWLFEQGLANYETYNNDQEVSTLFDAPTTVSKSNRLIACIDGMLILPNGEIRGLQWIALPMMEPKTK